MPSVCAVPYCTTNKKNGPKASTFKVPSDKIKLKIWENAIPGVRFLRSSHRICEKHFKEEEIARKWVAFNKNREVVQEVSIYK